MAAAAEYGGLRRTARSKKGTVVPFNINFGGATAPRLHKSVHKSAGRQMRLQMSCITQACALRVRANGTRAHGLQDSTLHIPGR